jgi:hypothetical protein
MPRSLWGPQLQRFLFVLLAIIVIGVLIFGAALVQANWYEYHFLTSGETPQNLVNQNGWEPMPGMETRNGVAFNYRRPRFLPHPNAEPFTAPAANAPSATTKNIQSKATALARAIRSFAIYDHPPASDKTGFVAGSYTSLRNAYTEFATELDTDGDSSDEAEAARAMIPQLKQAVETAYAAVNNDTLIRLAVQLDHVA